MYIASKLEDFAQIVHTSRDELIRCALEVTGLPEFTIEVGWLEEKLQVAHYAYGENVLRNPETEELAVWLRRTLPLVVGLNRNAGDEEFLKACAYSLEDYICNPTQHELVLYPDGVDVSAEERLLIDFQIVSEPISETFRHLFAHENYAELLRHEISHVDEETLRKYRMLT
jgi:hypothetical protein